MKKKQTYKKQSLRTFQSLLSLSTQRRSLNVKHNSLNIIEEQKVNTISPENTKIIEQIINEIIEQSSKQIQNNNKHAIISLINFNAVHNNLLIIDTLSNYLTQQTSFGTDQQPQKCSATENLKVEKSPNMSYNSNCQTPRLQSDQNIDHINKIKGKQNRPKNKLPRRSLIIKLDESKYRSLFIDAQEPQIQVLRSSLLAMQSRIKALQKQKGRKLQNYNFTQAPKDQNAFGWQGQKIKISEIKVKPQQQGFIFVEARNTKLNRINNQNKTVIEKHSLPPKIEQQQIKLNSVSQHSSYQFQNSLMKSISLKRDNIIKPRKHSSLYRNEEFTMKLPKI